MADVWIRILHCLGVGCLHLCLWDLGGNQLRHLQLWLLHVDLWLRRLKLWLRRLWLRWVQLWLYTWKLRLSLLQLLRLARLSCKTLG